MKRALALLLSCLLFSSPAYALTDGSSVTVTFVVWDTSANAPKTGDSGNLTMSVIRDGTRAGTTNAAAEVDATNTPGQYKIVLTAGECGSCSTITVCGKSSTANVVVVPVQFEVHTALSIPSAVQVRQEIDSNSTQLAAIVADTGELQTDWHDGGRLDLILDGRSSHSAADVVTALGTGSGLTSLAQAATALSNATWTDARAGYLTGNVALEATLTAIKGATFDTATDSLEALRDNLAPGATALTTATWTAEKAGFLDVAVSSRLAAAGYTAPLDAAATRTALGLATANLDTQLAAIVGDTGELQTDWHDGGRLDLLLDAATAPTAAQVADAICDELLAEHLVAGSVARALAAAGTAGDPWTATVPALYPAGSAGYLFGTLSSVKAKTDLITAGAISYVSPVASTGAISIVRGDSYADADGRALTWTHAAWSGPSLTGATVSFALIPTASYLRGDRTAALTVAGSVAVAGGTATFKVELTAVQTALLSANPPQQPANYRYILRVTTAAPASRTFTEALGACTVTADVP